MEILEVRSGRATIRPPYRDGPVRPSCRPTVRPVHMLGATAVDAARLSNWGPAALTAQAHDLPLGDFLSCYGGVEFLFVKVTQQRDPVACGLARFSSALTAGTPLRNVRTQQPCTSEFRLGDEVASGATVPGLLVDEPHFMVPIEKRRGSEDAMAVSVGRSRTNDIVLRHPSVSKNHAKFHVDRIGAMSVSDAGSRNHTLVNGESADTRVDLAHGDSVRFGCVEAVFASADQLWSMMHS